MQLNKKRYQIKYDFSTGMTLGTLICLPFTGMLASEFGWESVFYVQGGFSLIWYVLWLFFVYDSPMHHPRISRQERDFIYSSMGVTNSSIHNKPQVNNSNYCII